MFQAPNYTQVPNKFFEDTLRDLTLPETKVLLIIMRKTFGWHKIRDRISLSQLENLTGLRKQAILKATKSLVTKKIILKLVEGKKGSQQTFYELLIEDSNNSDQCVSHTPPSVFRTHTKETLTKENISPIVPKGDTPPLKQTKLKEVKVEVAPGVHLTNLQRSDLLRKMDNSDAKLTACFEKLSTWKISKGISGGLDYRSITNWVIKAVNEDLAKPRAVDRTQEHKQLAEKLRLQFPHNRDIEVGYNYVEFRMGRMGIPDPHLKFGDNGFEEQIENNLRKMGLRLSAQ